MAHVSIIVLNNGISASVKINMEPARLILVLADVWNVQEALVGQLCSLIVERCLVDGPELTLVLIVDSLLKVLRPKDMGKSLERHVPSTILHSAVPLVLNATGRQWIEPKVRSNAVWKDVQEVSHPAPPDVDSLLLENIRRLNGPCVVHHGILDTRIKEHWLTLHASHRIVYRDRLIVAKSAKIGARAKGRIDYGTVDVIVEHRK